MLKSLPNLPPKKKKKKPRCNKVFDNLFVNVGDNYVIIYTTVYTILSRTSRDIMLAS